MRLSHERCVHLSHLLINAMEDDDEIHCAVLTGDEAGGAFSAGANLKDPQTHTMA